MSLTLDLPEVFLLAALVLFLVEALWAPSHPARQPVDLMPLGLAFLALALLLA